MIKSGMLLIFSLLAPLAGIMPARATTLEEWANQADIVCSASFISVKETSERPNFDSNYSYTSLVATFRVGHMIKGHLPTHDLLLKTYRVDLRNTPTANGYAEFFTDFKVQQEYLLFAKGQTEQAKGQVEQQVYSLVAPYRSTASIIPVSSVSPRTGNPPLMNEILYTLISSLDNPRNEMSISSLIYVADYWKSHGREIDKNDGDTKSSSNLSLKSLYQTRIVPAVQRLSKSTDAQVRLEALYRGAQLQVKEVAPDLLSLAQSPSEDAEVAAAALGQFKPDTALPPLVSLLKSDNPIVRKTALDGLGNEKDRRALPFVLDTLNDTDSNVKYQATYALWQITGEMPPSAEFAFSSAEGRYQTFWKDWATKHKDELGRLRQQLENLRLENSKKV